MPATVQVHHPTEYSSGTGQTTDLGSAEPVFQQLSYGLDEARKLAVPLPWRLSAAGSSASSRYAQAAGS